VDLAEKMFYFIALRRGVAHSEPLVAMDLEVYGAMAFQLQKRSAKITAKGGFDRHHSTKVIRERRRAGERQLPLKIRGNLSL